MMAPFRCIAFSPSIEEWLMRGIRWETRLAGAGRGIPSAAGGRRAPGAEDRAGHRRAARPGPHRQFLTTWSGSMTPSGDTEPGHRASTQRVEFMSRRLIGAFPHFRMSHRGQRGGRRRARSCKPAYNLLEGRVMLSVTAD